MKKIKVLWFGIVPLGWFIALKMNIWITNYPVDWNNPGGLSIFLSLTGFFGSFLLIFGGIALAFYLQD